MNGLAVVVVVGRVLLLADWPGVWCLVRGPWMGCREGEGLFDTVESKHNGEVEEFVVVGVTGPGWWCMLPSVGSLSRRKWVTTLAMPDL